MNLRFKASELFQKNREADTRIIVNQGGSSSGKTYSVLQVLYVMALEKKLLISICSLAMPHLRKGALKDWIDILNAMGVYNENDHDKTNNVFTIGPSKVEFFSLDQPGKARGPRRDVLFINEANLIPYETFYQLTKRTKEKIFLDYNPADEFHWIYDKVLTRDDVTFIKSTYKDNPFLSEAIIKDIERDKDIDPNRWRVYGLGERGISHGTIYTHWDMCDALPQGISIWGLDFGYNDPMALVHVVIQDQVVYVEEEVYQSYLTTAELIVMMKAKSINRDFIYADSARPDLIQEIYRAGFNIKSSNKEIKSGIDKVKSMKLFITRQSQGLIKEIKSYKWAEDKESNLTEMPVDKGNHLMDAMRYAVHTHLSTPKAVNKLY